MKINGKEKENKNSLFLHQNNKDLKTLLFI